MLFQFCVTYSTICMAADSIYRIYTNNCCTIFHAIPEHCLYIHKLILQERKAISIPQPPYIHVCCIAEHVLRYFTILISGTINCTWLKLIKYTFPCREYRIIINKINLFYCFTLRYHLIFHNRCFYIISKIYTRTLTLTWK